MTPLELFNSLNFTKRKKAISVILNTKYSCNIVPKDDAKFFEYVINAHHRSHGDSTIHKLTIKPNPVYNHNNFYADFTAYGEKYSQVIGIGSTLSLNPDRDPNEIKRKKCLQFMRWVVGEFTNDIKLLEIEKDPHCKICGVEVHAGKSHLDHCGEVEFRHIAEAWLTPNLDRIRLADHDGSCSVFSDDALTVDWYDFHKENAEFQLTCPTCNLKKPKK